MKKTNSKRFRSLLESNKDKKTESIDDAIKKVKKNCTAKFNESIDVSFLLNVKQKKEEVNLRTIVNLPNGNGKKVKVAVLCEETKVKEAKEAGADICGSEDLIEIKNDKDGNLSTSIGKKDFSDDKIKQNYNSIIETILKEKPNNIKGEFIISAFLTSSMGISYKIKLAK